MIARYSRKEMVKIWSQQEKFNIWFQIEAHACDAQAELGSIPKESAKVIWEKGKFDIEKIDEIEKTTKNLRVLIRIGYPFLPLLLRQLWNPMALRGQFQPLPHKR